MKRYETSIMVKPDELNHHNTLFAGNGVKHLVEAGFFTVARQYKNVDEIVCYALNDFKFLVPVKNGSIITYIGQIVRLTTSTITVYVEGINPLDEKVHMSGMITYVIVDENTRQKKAHNLSLDECVDDKEKRLRRYANCFFEKSLK